MGTIEIPCPVCSKLMLLLPGLEDSWRIKAHDAPSDPTTDCSGSHEVFVWEPGSARLAHKSGRRDNLITFPRRS